MLNCFFCWSWINILKKAIAFILSWIIWVFMDHEFLKETKWLTKLFDLWLRHGHRDATHKKFVVFIVLLLQVLIRAQSIWEHRAHGFHGGIFTFVYHIVPPIHESFYSENSHFARVSLKFFNFVQKENNVGVLSFSEFEGDKTKSGISLDLSDRILGVGIFVALWQDQIEEFSNLLFWYVQRNILHNQLLLGVREVLQINLTHFQSTVFSLLF